MIDPSIPIVDTSEEDAAAEHAPSGVPSWRTPIHKLDLNSNTRGAKIGHTLNTVLAERHTVSRSLGR